jgi:4-carboxymuconolactone decarboxylase
MRFLILAAVIAAVGAAQSQKLLPDIDPQSFSRLPLLQRNQLSGEALKTFDAVVGKDANGKERATPPLGPVATSLYSPGVAEPMNKLNLYLRNTVVGPAMFQISALIAAREFNENYEWSAHEAGARRAMVDAKTVDAIRFNRGLEGLPDKDALVIRFGRGLLREHAVSPELYARLWRCSAGRGCSSSPR